ncbi:histidine kinase dimerization/phosphoacceptor domain -containing protein [Christiangramia sp.]|uniref:sensor histidine kinase n=1 Tax=Christiangramia sp. TaxID=1931228 RepID=UPI00262AB3AC|nr:histidine kinase dimerization/phosphoacceptor domain -containing protein [Christiangramia sp.]
MIFIENNILRLVFIFFLSFPVNGQIFDFSQQDPYKKVFVETDAFDASYLQELEDALKIVKQDTVYYNILNDLAYYWHTRNLVTALKFTRKGLKLTSQKKDSLWHGKFRITQGAILLRQEKLDAAEVVLKTAERKVEKIELPLLFTQLGYVYERRGKLDLAADYAMKSLALGEEINDDWARGMAYSDLSNLFWKQGKYDEGLKYGLMSLSFFERRNIEDLDYDFTLYIVGNNYLSLEKYEEAMDYYLRAITIGERYGFYNNLSDVYISLVALYDILDDFENAEKAGENAIKYAYLLDNSFMLMRSYLSVGELQIQNQDYSAAIENIEKSIAVATPNFGDHFFLSKAYNNLGMAYAGNEQYKEAYAAFSKYDSISSLVFTAEADQRIAQLETQFNVAQKENTIQQQGNRLIQQRTRQNLISLVAVLLFLTLTVLLVAFFNNRRKNRLLAEQNREKEFLLKEIHHRVKNNLQIVSSLLALQTAQTNNPTVVSAMKESQNRVYSMSMIHQRLYQKEHLSSIEMKDYLKNLGSHILESFGLEDRIQIVCHFQELHLDVDTAVPLGLIINELITNSLKYAFPNNRKGKIYIDLSREASGILKLEVKDNGLGSLADEPAKGTGFGKKLIELLTRQLDGSFKVNTTAGTQYLFLFKLHRM